MVNGKSDLVDVDYERVKIDDESKKAILFRMGGKDVWLPRSLVEVDEEAKTVALPEWLAMEKGLI